MLPIGGEDQDTGKGGDVVDVATPPPEKDDNDGEEKAAPEWRVGESKTQQEKQDGKYAGGQLQCSIRKGQPGVAERCT